MNKTDDLLQIHKQIFHYIKLKADNIAGEVPPLLEKYKKDHEQASNRKSSRSNIKEFLRSLHQSSIIYLGDFHTFDQSSRNFHRLLRHLIKRGYKINIGVEFVSAEYQVRINQFLQNLITEQEFLELVNYHESWRFPWEYYNVVFKEAKKNNINVFALNTEGSLIERDAFAAKTLVDSIDKKSKTIVLFGEYHIVSDKLPAQVNKEYAEKFKSQPESLIIHQNMDDIYWKYFDYSNIYKNQVIKFSNNEFVLLSSPPWVKYESMVYWFENYIDDPEFDLHEYIIESRPQMLGADVNENFFDICTQLQSTLGIDIHHDLIEDFNLCDNYNLSFILEKLNELPEKQKAYYNQLIKIGKIFKIPNYNIYYCSNYSVNRLSYLCGLHLHHLILNQSKEDYEQYLTKATDLEFFVFHNLQFALSYLCSKFVNPYRKCDLYLDFKNALNKADTQASRYVYQTTIKIIEGDNPVHIKDLLNTELFEKNRYKIQRLLGYFLGELIHHDLLSSNAKPIHELIKLIAQFDLSLDSFMRFKNEFITKEKYQLSRKRAF